MECMDPCSQAIKIPVCKTMMLTSKSNKCLYLGANGYCHHQYLRVVI